MRIAIISSGAGEKGLSIYEFFKEGNRVTVDSLLTDNPEAPIATTMLREGVEVVYILPDTPADTLTAMLKERGVELLVVDGFDSSLPRELEEAYAGAILTPTSAAAAPLEVIEAGKRRTAPPAATTVEVVEVFDGIESEWAEALKEDGEQTEGTEIPETPEASVPTEVSEVSEEHEESKTPETPEASKEHEAPQPTHHGATPPPYYGAGPQYGQPTPPQYRQPAPPQYQQHTEHREPMPNTYLIWSVLITIFCCLIPGIVAIVYSASVSSRYYNGDIEGAKRASRNAQIWCIISIVAGIIWGTLYLPLTLFMD